MCSLRNSVIRLQSARAIEAGWVDTGSVYTRVKTSVRPSYMELSPCLFIVHTVLLHGTVHARFLKNARSTVSMGVYVCGNGDIDDETRSTYIDLQNTAGRQTLFA
jgi:hypothetical protein